MGMRLMNQAGVPWEKCSVSISKDWVWLGHSCSLPLVSWPLGDFYKVARAETAPACPPGTKPQHEGSLKGPGRDVLRGPHPTRHTLEPEPQGTSAWRCCPFWGRTADISVQTPPGQPRASLMGRTSYLVHLCSSSWTPPQPNRAVGLGLLWPQQPLPGNVWQQAAHAHPKVVRIWPFEGGTWALELQSATANPGNQTQPWGCFIWLIEVRFLWSFFTDTSQGPPNTQNIRA